MSNLTAFLALIAHAEGTDRAPDPYRVCYAYRHTIADLSDHPAITGEWKGEPLDGLGPQYAGLISTAAGKYQITKHTWINLHASLNLPDFGPQSQDRAATLLIRQHGALEAVNGGRTAEAVRMCSTTWASLPGSAAGQPTRDMGALLAFYVSSGGAYA